MELVGSFLQKQPHTLNKSKDETFQGLTHVRYQVLNLEK